MTKGDVERWRVRRNTVFGGCVFGLRDPLGRPAALAQRSGLVIKVKMNI